MRQLGLSLADAIAGAALIVIGSRCLLQPRRLRELALRNVNRGLNRLWPWSRLAKRVESSGYLWELRIIGVLTILMGIIFGLVAFSTASGRTHV
jgi:hypothetical protein